MTNATSIQGRTVATTAPTAGDAYVWDADASEWRPGRPLPPGWFDPRDYGAICDGVTDDLPAYEAMHAAMSATGGVVHLPPGVSWLSDTWRVSKPVDIIGPSGGNGRFYCGFEVAPGRTAIRLESAGISSGGTSAQYGSVRGVDLRSRLLLHGSANGSALGFGIDPEWNSGPISKNACIIASSGAHPARFWRCTNTGNGDATVTLTAEPNWSVALDPGDTVTQNGATFECEAFPMVRENSTAYAVGERIWPAKDNRYIFECTTAGTSDSTAPVDLAGGDAAPGIGIGTSVTDGTVTWLVTMAAGILVAADVCTIERVYATGFTGPGLANIGGEGMFEAGMTFADCTKYRDIHVQWCGLGAYFAGSDSNGWLLDGMFVINCGTLMPTPNAAAAADMTGLGGHCLHDRSLASGLVSNLYCQLSTGRTILKNGLGRMTVLSGFDELGADGRAYFTNGVSTIVGGSISATPNSDSVIHLDFEKGRGLQAVGEVGAQSGIAAVIGQGKAFTLQVVSETDGVGFIGWSYGYGTPAGWWGLQHGNQQMRNAFLIATSNAGMNPGPGWLNFQDGYLLGDITTVPLFFGHANALTKNDLRCGERKTGDRFATTSGVRRLTGDGFKGVPWSANTGVRATYEPWGIPANIVEPTSNTGTSSGGEKVFRCSVAGTTGAVEPNWSAAVIVGDTVNDNGAVWEYIGVTPSWTLEGGGQVELAMADANQTLPTALAEAAIIKTTGALTADRDLVLPSALQDGDARVWTVRNTCTGAFGITVKTAGGSSVLVGNGKTAQVGVDTGGAFRVTADT